MKFCPYCGAKVMHEEARFCMSCGKSLESFQSQAVAPAPAKAPAPKSATTGKEYSIDSKIKGTVLDVIAGVGDVVESGYLLMTITNYFSGETEPIYATKKAYVNKVAVKKGQTVNPNDKLISLAEIVGNVEVLPPAQDDDFFGEFSEAVDSNPGNAAPSGDDFFGELDNAADREVDEALATIQEAENYFMRGDFLRAEDLLKPFADKGIDRVNYMLGLMYESGGNGIIPDSAAAVEFLSKSEGDLPVLHLFNFFGDESSSHYAALKKAIWENPPSQEALNDPFMRTEFGIYLGKTRGQIDKFISYLTDAEQQGYWLASIMLGMFYQGEMGNKPDYMKAVEHYWYAVKKDIPLAKNSVGLILKLGLDGIKTDYKLAKELFLSAADYINDNVCLFHLADIYLMEGNVVEGMRWHDRNVTVNEDGDSAAQLGYLLLNIDDNAQIPTDYQRALQLCQFALSKNEKDTLALFGVGWSYLIGEAVGANEDTARYYFNLAKQHGYNTIGGQFARKALEAMNKPQQNQNSGGCFITTAVCDSFNKPDDCFELTTFRKFRDGWLAAQPDGKALIAEYYSIAPPIVAKINRLADAAQIYKNIWQEYLEPCLNFIRVGDNLSCKKLYVEMVHELKARFC